MYGCDILLSTIWRILFMPNQRIAIVTGGMRGIGLAITQSLVKSQMRVAVGSRDAAHSNHSQKAHETVGKDGLVAPLDVTSLASIDTFLDQVRMTLGHPEILVNCAGVSCHHPVEGHLDEDWEQVLDVNLSGPFRMIRACLASMKQRGWGRIVNIASTAARTAQATHAAYCASKAGLVGLTRAVAMEGGPYGINCISISPTWVETDMLRDSARIMAKESGKSDQDIIREMAENNVQGRLVQPDEIGRLVAFCCSDSVAGLTMEDIQVNAGAWW